MKKRILDLLGLFIFTPFIFSTTLFCQGTDYVCKQVQSCQSTGYSRVLNVVHLPNDTVIVTRSIRSSQNGDEVIAYNLTSNSFSVNDSSMVVSCSGNTWFIPFSGALMSYNCNLDWRFCCNCSLGGGCAIDVLDNGNRAKCKETDCLGGCCSIELYQVTSNKFGPGILLNGAHVVLAGQ